jgi:hypothetical protein
MPCKNADVQYRQMPARDSPCCSMPHRSRPERRSDHGQNDLDAAGDHMIASRSTADEFDDRNNPAAITERDLRRTDLLRAPHLGADVPGNVPRSSNGSTAVRRKRRTDLRPPGDVTGMLWTAAMPCSDVDNGYVRAGGAGAGQRRRGRRSPRRRATGTLLTIRSGTGNGHPAAARRGSIVFTY